MTYVPTHYGHLEPAPLKIECLGGPWDGDLKHYVDKASILGQIRFRDRTGFYQIDFLPDPPVYRWVDTGQPQDY